MGGVETACCGGVVGTGDEGAEAGGVGKGDARGAGDKGAPGGC